MVLWVGVWVYVWVGYMGVGGVYGCGWVLFCIIGETRMGKCHNLCLFHTLMDYAHMCGDHDRLHVKMILFVLNNLHTNLFLTNLTQPDDHTNLVFLITYF